MLSRGGVACALLRARGGISVFEAATLSVGNSSPRTRRYFHLVNPINSISKLFSAHAEVFPWHAPR